MRRLAPRAAAAVVLALAILLAPEMSAAQPAGPGRDAAAAPAAAPAAAIPDAATPDTAAPAPPVAAAVGATGPTAAPAVKSPTSTSPPIDPQYPFAGYLQFVISGVTPSVITATGGQVLTVTGIATNISKVTLYDLRCVFQRGDALNGVAAIRTAIARPSRQGTVVGQNFKVFGSSAAADHSADVAPGARVRFVATVAISTDDGLALRARGVFPLMIKVTGDIGQQGRTQYERVGELHLLATVLAPPTRPIVPAATNPAGTTGPAGPAGAAGAAGTKVPDHPAVPVNMLWPLVDSPHLGVGGIFLDDVLAKELAPGGRLYELVEQLSTTDPRAAPTTVLVDPALLDEVDRMSVGYRVVSVPGTAQPPLTPTSAAVPATSGPTGPTSVRFPGPVGSGAQALPSAASGAPRPAAAPATASSPTGSTAPVTDPVPSTTPGVGQQVALTFLNRLRSVLAGRQVLVLPYSDPDSVAMIRAGMTDTLASLITTGRTVAGRILQMRVAAGPGEPGLITTMARPPGGLVDDATLAFLSSRGLSEAVLAPSTLHFVGSPLAAAAVDESVRGGAVVHAVITDATVGRNVEDALSKGTSAGVAVRLNNLAALLAGSSFDGTATALIIAPDNRWTANAGGLRVVGDLFRTLRAGGILSGASLPSIAVGAHRSASVGYPSAALKVELNPQYLGSVQQTADRIATMRASLTQGKGTRAPQPADLLDELSSALDSTRSTALRSDDAIAQSILTTCGATLDHLRDRVSIVGDTVYTLAASTAPLLITVRNDLPYVAKLQVVIRGGSTFGMTATDPGVFSIPAGASHQFKIDTSTVKAGRFPVHAVLLAADGSKWRADTVITVKSSAYGTLTIVLIAVGGAILLLMVVLRIVQRVRGAVRRSGSAGPDSDTKDSDTRGTRATGRNTAEPEPDSILAAANQPDEVAGRTTPNGYPADEPGADNPLTEHPGTEHPGTDGHSTDPGVSGR